VTGFAQITSNTDVQAKLKALYGTVNNIDAWVGALAEDHVAGSSTGPLIRAVLVDQFERLRDGDRFWYQRTFNGAALRSIDQTTLADVIRRDSTTTNLQANAFFFRVGVSGTVFADGNRDGVLNNREQGLSGRTVQLVDAATSTVIASAVTDGQGRYSFDVADGLGLGRYQVRVILASGQVQTTATRTIALTKGETFVTANLGVATSRRSPQMARAASPRAAGTIVDVGPIGSTLHPTTMVHRRALRGV
jgi:hypothetical protein